MSTKTKTAADIKAELEKIDYECIDLQRRHDEIEQAIADNWNDDTADLQTEYAGIAARLKAAERVKAKLQAQWLELYTSEHVAIFESKSEAAYNARNEAQVLTAQAQELQAQAQALLQQAATLQKHHDSWCKQSLHWVEDRQKEGITDLSGFVEAVNKYQLPSSIRHWHGGWGHVIPNNKRQAG